eukprot:jgi/Botrbrau1/4045/Bobra.152_3s0006.1
MAVVISRKREGRIGSILVYVLSLVLLDHSTGAPVQRVDPGTKDVWLPWRGAAPKTGQIAQKRLCPARRHLTEVTVHPTFIAAKGAATPRDLNTQALPAIEMLTGRCSREDPSDIPWVLLAPDSPVHPAQDFSILSSDLGTTVYGSATAESVELFNATTLIQGSEGQETLWIGNISFISGPAPSDAITIVDVCPPGMVISGWQVNQGPVLLGISWRCSCTNCGCDCMDNKACTAGPSPSMGKPLLPWCHVNPTPSCSIHFNAVGDQGPWYWCSSTNATSTVLAEKTAQGCMCASPFTFNMGSPRLTVVSQGSCIAAGASGRPWCVVMEGSCPPNAKLWQQRDASGMNASSDYCQDYPGEGAPALMVDVRAASVESPRKAPMEGHVVGAIVVVIMIAAVTLLAVVLYRFKEGCMYKSKAVLQGHGKPWTDSPFGRRTIQNSDDFDSAINHPDPDSLKGTNGVAREDSSLHTLLESLPPLHPQPSWKISPNNISFVKRPDGSDWILGTGAFGTVYRALMNGVQPVAVKVMESQDTYARQAVAREIAILKDSRNPHIVQFLGACVGTDGKMLVVMELMDQGTLFQAIADGRVSWYNRGRKIALDVAMGLAFLHSHNIVHLDIKSNNVLLARNLTAKISDVGLARVLQSQSGNSSLKGIGTYSHAAPEVLAGPMKVAESADIYSFGVLLWEIVTTDLPKRGGNREVKVPEECPQEIADLIQECTSTDPDKRPTASELVKVLSNPSLGRKPTIPHDPALCS